MPHGRVAGGICRTQLRSLRATLKCMHFIVGPLVIAAGLAQLLFHQSFVRAQQNDDGPFTALRQGEEMRRFGTFTTKATGICFIIAGVVVLVVPGLGGLS